MPWWGSHKIWITILVLVPLTAFAATEATVTLSLGTVDHLFTLLESGAVCLTACGSFYLWISKTRTERVHAITQEITVAVASERDAREDDIGGLEHAVAKLSNDVEIIRNSSAKVEDVANLYRLVEKVADRADSQHQALRDQMTRLIGDVAVRLDRISERRLAPREGD